MLGMVFVKMERIENNTNQYYDNNTAYYSAEFDCFEENEWYQIISKFEDANIFQTWAYGEIRFGGENVSHFVLKKNGEVVAAAQVIIYKLPVIKKSIGYIRWGPLWRPMCSEEADTAVFRHAIRALRDEYVLKRGMILRIRPLLFEGASDPFVNALGDERYSKLENEEKDRTLIIGLEAPIENLRMGIKKKWRYYLRQAEVEGLEVVEGETEELFEEFIGIYKEMLERKKFVVTSDINEFKIIQKYLPEMFKMKVMICYRKKIPVNGIILSALGTTGIYLFGATNRIGLQSSGAYLLQWKAIEWLKKGGYKWYDLNGINPKNNPGTYQFKTGLCGKNGRDVYFLGQFDAYPNELFRYLIHWGDGLRRFWRRG